MEDISFFRKEMASYGETSEILEEILTDPRKDDSTLRSDIRRLFGNTTEGERYSEGTYKRLETLLKEHSSINETNERTGLPRISEREFFRKKMETYFSIQERLEEILKASQKDNASCVSAIRHILGGEGLDDDLQQELESILSRYRDSDLER